MKHKTLKNSKFLTIDNITPEVRERIEELRTIFKKDLAEFPEINTDWYLLRFLRSRNCDLKKSSAMLEKFIDFRKKKKPSLSKNHIFDREKIKSLYIRGYYNITKDGCPILIERIGKSKTIELLNYLNEDDLNDFFIQIYERLFYIIFPICSQKQKKRIDKIYVILDLKGIKLRKLFSPNSKFKKFLKNFLFFTQNYYPELMNKLIIINAPLIFSFFWTFVKKFLDKSTTDKIKIFSRSGKKEIFKLCDPENIPTFLGGKCEIPLGDEPGPWKKEYDKSLENRNLFLQDRSIEYEYFLSKFEKSKINQKKKYDLSTQYSTNKSKNSKEFYMDSLKGLDQEVRSVGKIRLSNIMVKF